jgi:hypothetical protein
MFVTSQGHAYARFRRALEVGNLKMIRTAALELDRVGLPDALKMVVLMAQSNEPQFDRACMRWLGRFCLEAKRATVSDLDRALECFRHIGAGQVERGSGGLDALCQTHKLV